MKRFCALAIATLLAAGVTGPVRASDVKAPDLSLATYPPDGSASQTIRVGGNTFGYTATAGVIPIHDEANAVIGALSFVAYTMPLRGGERRPVTFAMNGGPGAASIPINLRGLGPKRVEFDPAKPGRHTLIDNPDSWLPFTDLVFIDAMGTGFSRSFLPPAESRRAFYTYDSDVRYLSEAIHTWLRKNGRMSSEKHFVGESYSGYRAPRILAELQERFATPFDGLVLLSPLMNQDQSKQINVLASPVPWISSLPTATAAALDRQGKLTASAMAAVEQYARTDYAAAMLDGWRHPSSIGPLADKLSVMTGLDRAYLVKTGGRIEPHSYLRAIYAQQGRLANYYDVTLSYPEPFPVPDDDGTIFEELVDSTSPDVANDMSDFLTRTLHWRPDLSFLGSNPDVNSAFIWARGTSENESYSVLRRILAQNTRLKVMIAHGYSDMACPYFADELAVDLIPPEAGRARVRTAVYPGGHMFYNRPTSLHAFTRDARALYAPVPDFASGQTGSEHAGIPNRGTD